MTGVLIRSRHMRRKHDEMSEAGITVMLPQDEEDLRLPEA